MKHNSKWMAGTGLAMAAMTLLTAASLHGRAVAQDSARLVDATGAPLAPDVDPRTLSRLPLPTPAELGPATPLRNGQPAPTDEPQRLYSPKLAEAMNAAHRYVKYESGIDDRLTAIAVLVTARMANSQFEWTRWEMHGRKPGDTRVQPEIVDIIKYCKPVVGLPPKETAIINFGREMFGPTEKVSSQTYADAVRLFGRQGVVDLVDLMGLYKITALEIKAFDARLDPKAYKPLLPPMSATPNCGRA
jgi:4-carboxymuconolactone decarboxylase